MGQLVLTRKLHEHIMIGDNIRVAVVDIRGDKVRLGIDAPPTIAVHRAEVYQSIMAQRAAAEAEGAR